MNFGLSEDQTMLRDQAQRFVEERCPMTSVRRISEQPEHDAALWRELAELGWAGLLIPEENGGAGLGWVDAAVLLEAVGTGLLPAPLASSLLASSAISELGSDEQKARYLPKMAAGEAIGTLALFDPDGGLDVASIAVRAKPVGDGYVLTGDKAHVHDASSSDFFIVATRAPSGPLLVVVERTHSGVQAADHAIIDRTKRTGSVALRDVEVPRGAVLAEGDAAAAAFERLVDLGAVAMTAEMVGAADAVHQLTVNYAKERTQFGKQIGQYQGVKHPLADMYVDIETFRSLVYYAAWTAEGSPQELPRHASMAKAYASDAFAQIGINAIQLHGAIGYTAEYDAQLYLKRSKWARPAFGDSDYHYERIASLGGL